MEENGGKMATLNIKGFPEELYSILVKEAENDRRSLTGEVIYLLEKALAESKKKHISILQLKGLGKHLWTDIHTTEHIAKERDAWD